MLLQRQACGIARNTRYIKPGAKEKPRSAKAVAVTLTKVPSPVPSLVIIFSLRKLEIMVPALIIIIMPAALFFTARLICKTGHAKPGIESGRPNLIKVRYMIVKNNADMILYYYKNKIADNVGKSIMIFVLFYIWNG